MIAPLHGNWCQYRAMCLCIYRQNICENWEFLSGFTAVQGSTFEIV